MTEILAHTTYNEMQFIDSIGTNSIISDKPLRFDFLAGYIIACYKRTNWDNMDKKMVISYAKKELKKERELLEIIK